MKCPNCDALLDATDTPFVQCSYCGGRFENKDATEVLPFAMRPGVFRSILEDKNHDGIPDIFQNGEGGYQPNMVVQSTFTVNGKTYDDINEVPPEIRKLMEAVNLSGNNLSTPLREIASTKTVTMKVSSSAENTVIPSPSSSKTDSGFLKTAALLAMGAAIALVLLYLFR